MVEEIVVKSPSRLHFGLIDLRGDLGRIYCSVGVAIEHPNVVLKAYPNEELVVEGERRDEAIHYAKAFFKKFRVEDGVRICIQQTIPEHVGLGSGTQLALSIGSSLAKLFEIDTTVEEISRVLHRGEVSGVGTYAFKLGGFILDGGQRVAGPRALPPLLLRHEFPSDWYFVVGVPKTKPGLSGRKETEHFSKLPLMTKEATSEIARLVLVKMIPSLIERDIVGFGQALTDLDFKTGDYWSSIQGGRFSDPVVEEGVDFMLDQGAYGAGQSSWGPAFYGLVEGEKGAIDLEKALDDFLAEKIGGTTFYTKPNNSGVWLRRSV